MFKTKNHKLRRLLITLNQYVSIFVILYPRFYTFRVLSPKGGVASAKNQDVALIYWDKTHFIPITTCNILPRCWDSTFLQYLLEYFGNCRVRCVAVSDSSRYKEKPMAPFDRHGVNTAVSRCRGQECERTWVQQASPHEQLKGFVLCIRRRDELPSEAWMNPHVQSTGMSDTHWTAAGTIS